MNSLPLPVTVLSGFFGAGKTTLLNHLLTNGEGLRIAAIVSDRGDAGHAEMSEGCERHVLSDDLAATIERLAAEGRFDAIVVESSGAADPIRVAEHLALAESEGEVAFPDIARLDTMVTVVDASSFLRDYAHTGSLVERDADHDADDDRTVVEVLVEQVEFCDVIVVNKTDLVTAEALARLRHVLHALNPRAVLIDARFADVPVSAVVNTERFDFDETASAAGWLMTLHDQLDENPEAAQTGIAHLVYRARRPFHPERLWGLLNEEWPHVLRAKGFFWLATRNDVGGSLSQAGGVCRQDPAGIWWAAQDRSEWPTGDAELEAEIVADWHGDPDDMTVGDRRQELVLIGIDLDKHAWHDKFDACLLTDEEWALGPEGWKQFADPFPSWDIDEHDHDHDHGDDCDCGHRMH
ncbi:MULTISPECIES: GTP-binding protein [unclassified Caballeronia]|uniref:GTP-binding protein n=1 Tax=unclassified Caballeronia TaxID=2646786 RepID=UPI002856CC5A|nr:MULTISPECIES: GTP-binding protein [unclassified Caballeronia]MDR5752035.1 GTP-binding protein [Caballeronia sp. LZ024]MDR5843824.1 GTP-binding protein [Caballeronia sp. LZ031]